MLDFFLSSHFQSAFNQQARSSSTFITFITRRPHVFACINK